MPSSVIKYQQGRIKGVSSRHQLLNYIIFSFCPRVPRARNARAPCEIIYGMGVATGINHTRTDRIDRRLRKKQTCRT